MTSDDIISQSFGIILPCLNYIGLYCPEEMSLFFKVRSYLFYICLLLPATICIDIIAILERNLDPMESTNVWIFAFQMNFGALKILPFLIKGDKVKKCINYFGHQQFKPETEEGKRIVKECVHICQINCKIYLFAVVSSMVLWLIPTVFSKETKLPLKIWLPFNPKSSPQVFYSTLVFLLIVSVYGMLALAFIDPLIGSLSFHATSQLKILKYNLKIFCKFQRNSDQNCSFITLERAHNRLKECVKHHNDILDFVSEFERCFSWSIFCQFAATTLSLCFVIIGLSLTTSLDVEAVIFFFFFILLVLQELFYCYFGSLLLEENEGFVDAVCEGPWYKYDPKIRKVLILMMERAKKPLAITAGKVISVTLQTYTSILKTSYSLIAVMKHLQ